MDNRNNNQQPEERSPQDLAVKNPEHWKTGEEERTAAQRGTEEGSEGTEQSVQRGKESEGGR